jgi:PST family polysaccharide transporter
VTAARSNEELTEATARGLRWVTYGRLVTEVLLLVSMVALARLIPPSAFGMFAIAVIVQELAINVPSEGVASAIVQRDTVDRAHLQGGFALALLIGAALTLLGLVLCVVVVNPVFGHQTATMVAWTTPWFLLGATVALPQAMLRRDLDFRRLSMLTLAQSAGRSGVTILLAAGFGLDGPALVFGSLAGILAMTILGFAFQPVPFPRWRSAAIRDLLPYGGPASLACFCWAGFRNGDYAIVGARLGAAQAGFYWRGYQLAVEYQSKISSMMTQMAFPVLARTAGEDELFAMRRRMVQLLTTVSFPLLCGLVILAPTLIPWLFGPAWEPAVLPTQILAGAGASSVVIDAVGAVLMATGRSRAMLGYGIAHFAVYIVAVLIGSRWGLTGVSIASVSSHAVFLVVAYQVMLHGRGEPVLRFLWQDLRAGAVGAAVMAAVAVPLDAAVGGAGVPAFAHLAIVGAVAGVAYVLAVWRLFPAAWADLSALLRRVLPSGPVRRITARVPALAGRSS